MNPYLKDFQKNNYVKNSAFVKSILRGNLYGINIYNNHVIRFNFEIYNAYGEKSTFKNILFILNSEIMKIIILIIFYINQLKNIQIKKIEEIVFMEVI